MNSKEVGAPLEHSGFVGIIGRPNVGKSTFINQMARRKLAITSDKPQTTRHTISAVINYGDAQMVLIDTPGLHKPKDGLGERLNKKVRRTMADADAAIFMVDGAAGIGTGDKFIAGELQKSDVSVVLAVNKTDIIDKKDYDSLIRRAETLIPGAPVYLISAAKGAGLKELLSELTRMLPPGPKYFPNDVLTDQPERVLIGEIIREKLIEATREELPYAIAVEVYEIKKRRKDLIDVRARIHVERSSQKGIVIGRGGSLLEQVGRAARAEIEGLLGSQVYLDIIVKVTKDWRKMERKAEELGY